MEDVEKGIIDALKLVAPGSPLRSVLNDVVRSGLGAMIVLDSPVLKDQNMLDGGFRLHARFSPQRLFELCKMDGGIVVSSDLKRVLYANVLLTPDASIHTSETGTRHKSSERVAKQASTTVITVSERRKKITLYVGSSKHVIRSTDELRGKISSTIQILEKQREILKEDLGNLNILEMSELVSVADACRVIQRTRMILKISDSIKKSFIELGREGSMLHMRFRELIRGVEKVEREILRDYSVRPLKKSKTIIANLTYDGLLELESISRLIIEKPLEDAVIPRGFRFLSHLPLSDAEKSQFVAKFGDLKGVLLAESKDFESVVKNRSVPLFEEVSRLREQVLSGKVVC